MAQAPPVVLTIAGFDPSSGAGVTADIKTTAAHGCYGVACIAALTVQSTAGARREVGVWRKYVFRTPHEVIGIQYIITALSVAIVGGTLTMLMRYHLAWPTMISP